MLLYFALSLGEIKSMVKGEKGIFSQFWFQGRIELSLFECQKELKLFFQIELLLFKGFVIE
jgi:hypothetical protein